MVVPAVPRHWDSGTLAKQPLWLCWSQTPSRREPEIMTHSRLSPRVVDGQILTPIRTLKRSYSDLGSRPLPLVENGRSLIDEPNDGMAVAKIVPVRSAQPRARGRVRECNAGPRWPPPSRGEAGSHINSVAERSEHVLPCPMIPAATGPNSTPIRISTSFIYDRSQDCQQSEKVLLTGD
jgi:hypothetical protein